MTTAKDFFEDNLRRLGMNAASTEPESSTFTPALRRSLTRSRVFGEKFARSEESSTGVASAIPWADAGRCRSSPVPEPGRPSREDGPQSFRPWPSSCLPSRPAPASCVRSSLAERLPACLPTRLGAAPCEFPSSWSSTFPLRSSRQDPLRALASTLGDWCDRNLGGPIGLSKNFSEPNFSVQPRTQNAGC